MHQIAKDITGVGKTEVQLMVAAPIDVVWEKLTDIERWPEFTRLLEYSPWNSAEHWAVGSSFTVRITWPFAVTVTLVVTAFQPKLEIRWVTHAILNGHRAMDARGRSRNWH